MSIEAKERILKLGDREVMLKCPICGGEQFYKQEARVDTSVFTSVLDNFAYYYACESCSYMIWMEKDTERRIINQLTPVAMWERKFRTWGYAENEAALRMVLSDDGYHEDAHIAARNLLENLRKQLGL